MGKRKCFIISLLLVIGALASNSVSERYLSKSTMLLARSLTIPEPDKTETKVQSDKFSHKSSIFYYSGLGLAILSLALWIVSEVRREPAWRLIIPILLCLYLVLQFIVV